MLAPTAGGGNIGWNYTPWLRPGPFFPSLKPKSATLDPVSFHTDSPLSTFTRSGSSHIMAFKTLLCAVLALALPVSSQSTWSTLSPVPVGGTLQEHTTVAINDSLLAVVGGLVEGGDTTDNVLLYDIPGDTWRQVAPLPVALNHPNVVVSGENIYVLGGLGGERGWPPVRNTFQYDADVDQWEELQSIPEGSERGSAITVVHGDRIFLAGGIPGGSGESVDDVSIFDLESGEWLEVPEEARHIPAPRDHGGGAVIDGKFYVVGGRDAGLHNVRDTVFILDLEDLEGGWRTSEAAMPTARGGLSVAAIGTMIYAFGGEGNPEEGTDGVFDDVEVYDTETDAWEVLEPMQLPRHGTSAAAVDGRIYIPGGGIVEGVGATDVFDVFSP